MKLAWFFVLSRSSFGQTGQQNIIEEYKDDMVKYAADEDKARIRECFESIPRQLAKENKKFQYSVVKKGVARLSISAVCSG